MKHKKIFFAKKKRKLRGIKKDGTRSLDLCLCCGYFHCDSMCGSPPKVRKRLSAGLCPGCGEEIKYCRCKSSLLIW